jgi:hypothetical protein
MVGENEQMPENLREAYERYAAIRSEREAASQPSS